MNILFLTNELNYTCGVTNHILHLTGGLLKINGNNVSIICGGGNGLNRFRNSGIKVTADSRFLHENRSIASYTSAIVYLTKYIVKNKTDIIHSHSHYTANIARNSSRLFKVHTIQTNHGLLSQKSRLKHFNAERYIAINEHIYDYIIKNKIAKKQDTGFIRCGIPVPPMIPVKNNTKLKVLAASRFVSEKGLDIYIKAVSKLNSNIKSKADFYIAGEGELNKQLLKMNKELGANISFLGSVKDIYQLLKKTDILVYSSRSASEGFPAIITEAGANGVLVISSSFKGADCVLENNENCIIFEQDNVNELVKILGKVIEKFSMYSELAPELYKKVQNWFSLEKMIKKHNDLYTECLRN